MREPAAGGPAPGQGTTAPEDVDHTDPERAHEPGAIDDGESLLFAAAITVESSVAAAREAAAGEIGEVDLEIVNGDIVFIVDVGDNDVHVDAETGAVLSVNGED